VIDGDLQPPLNLRIASEPRASLLPDIRFEEKRWQLCQIEIIDNTETISTGGPIPNCTGQHVSLASVECAFDGRRCSVPKTLSINVSDDGTELQLHITDPLPDNFGSWEESGSNRLHDSSVDGREGRRGTLILYDRTNRTQAVWRPSTTTLSEQGGVQDSRVVGKDRRRSRSENTAPSPITYPLSPWHLL